MASNRITNKMMAELLRERGQFLHSEGRYSTALNYLRTAKSYSCFLTWGLAPSEDGVFDSGTVRSYDSWLLLERGVCRNSASFYQRILRAVWVYSGGCAELFDGVFTGVEGTRKRAVPVGVLRSLAGLELEGTKAFCRDLFLFSFMARGMSYVDMVFLRKQDVRGGRIMYMRRKTGRMMSVGLERGMEDIIERWRSPEGSPFVFPVVCSGGEDGFRQYESGLSLYNIVLKDLGRQVGCPGLSGYAARHSWATAARRSGIPLGLISEGLGHSSERTTRIYLASFDAPQLDSVNRSILDAAGL